MQEIPLQGPYQAGALEALQKSPLFGSLQPQEHETILTHGKLFEYEGGEVVVEEGQPSDSFYFLIRGQAVVKIHLPNVPQPIEVGRVNAPEVFGEMGLLLRNARTATVIATDEVLAIRFHHRAFDLMLNSIKGFTIQLCVTLARRLAQTSRRIPPPPLEPDEVTAIDPQILRQLPTPFILRHRVLPVKLANNVLSLGFVDEPTPAVIKMVQRIVPGVQIQPRRISNEGFTQALRSHGLYESPSLDSDESISITGAHLVVGKSATQDLLSTTKSDEERKVHFERLLPLLKRMVAEGASDLYLSAQEKPRWRIGEQLYVIEDQRPLQPLEPFLLLSSVIPEPRLEQFEQDHYVEFSCTIPELSRFRVGLFRSEKGTNALLRSIPLSPPHPKQLQLPSALRHITKFDQGLVLFSGPPGSGKTTTIAALLEVINHHRSLHIVTLEDPIEYVHSSQNALFHQREIGSHTHSLKQALTDVLRHTPDILVVSDLRDHESLSLALEAARNRCLVFASMAVRGSVRTIGQLVDLFPPELQQQARLTLAKVLRCVVSQELCRHTGGGRVAAFEYLAIDGPSAEAIRKEDPTSLIKQLNEKPENLSIEVHLAQLVQNGMLSRDEAYSHTVNRGALESLLGNALPLLSS